MLMTCSCPSVASGTDTRYAIIFGEGLPLHEAHMLPIVNDQITGRNNSSGLFQVYCKFPLNADKT